MILYLYTGLLSVYETKQMDKTKNRLSLKQKRGIRKKKTEEDAAWNDLRHNALVNLYSLLRLPLKKLWDPPIVEEDFINLIANICYKTLEDPGIKNLKALRETLFQILGTLIKNYNHGYSFSVKIVKILKTFEHTNVVLSEGIEQLVKEYNCKSLISLVVREIIDWQATEQTKNAAETRQCSLFLVELATKLGELIISELDYLEDQLENENNSIRSAVLQIMAEVLCGLKSENLSKSEKELRDNLLDRLEDHFYDVSAIVRAKVLHLWSNLHKEQAIPLARQTNVLDKGIERLKDKSSIVRKNAIAFVKTMLEYNPYAGYVDKNDIETKLEREQKKFKQINEKLSKHDDLKNRVLWMQIHHDVKAVIQTKLLEATQDELPRNINHNGNILHEIKNSLLEKKFEDAFLFVRVASVNYKNITEMDYESKINCYLTLLHNIFMDPNADLPSVTDVSKPPTVADAAEEEKRTLDELSEEFILQNQIVTFLEEQLSFVTKIHSAVPIMKNLLRTKNVGECNEVIEFFTTSFKFRMEFALDGALEMLCLVWSTEQDRKEAVAKAFKFMFLTTEAKSKRDHAIEVVKNLVELVQVIEIGHYLALLVLVKTWVENGDIDRDILQVLWELFTFKLPAIDKNYNRAALKLLSMVANTKPEIVKSNLNVLEKYGLGGNAADNLYLVEDTFDMLMKLDTKVRVDSNKPPFRLKHKHSIVTRTLAILKDTFKSKQAEYISMSKKAIDFIYLTCDQPDKICSELISNLNNQIEEQTVNNKIPSWALKQFVMVVGQVAIRQLIYLDETVYKELKRRERCRNELQNKKENRKPRKQRSARNESIASNRSSASFVHAQNKNMSALDEEQQAVEGEDADAEYITNVCENELLSDDSVLGSLLNMIIEISENPRKYDDVGVQTACTLALGNLMSVSSIKAEKNLQLLFTILKKSKTPKIRGNTIIVIADLAKRFPNNIEPWIPHLYQRLRDDSDMVRHKTVMMLSYLLLHEFIRVKAQISDMALCIIDPNVEIAELTKNFFRQLSMKGNSLYNVMPDIISRLSDPDLNLDEDDFQIILGYLMSLIRKDKQIEALTEKLCARLRISTIERQWSDLAYCLSLINYNGRSMRRLIENIPSFKDMLQNSNVNEAFKTIISKSNKKAKPEMKALVTELSQQIQECLKISENEVETEKGQPASAGKKSEGKNKVQSVRKNNRNPRRRRRRRSASSESDDSEGTEDKTTNSLIEKGDKSSIYESPMRPTVSEELATPETRHYSFLDKQEDVLQSLQTNSDRRTLRRSSSLSDLFIEKSEIQLPASNVNNAITDAIETLDISDRTPHASSSSRDDINYSIGKRKPEREDMQPRKYIRSAEEVREFQYGTPNRFRSSPRTQETAFRPLPVTISQSPALATKTRIRPVHTLLQKELELEEMKKMQFKAHGINEGVQASRNLGIRVEREPVTTPEPFILTENRNKPVAQSVPSKIFKRVVGVKQKKLREIGAKPVPQFKTVEKSLLYPPKIKLSKSLESLNSVRDKENRGFVFKAQPATVLKKKPFRPLQPEHKPVEFNEFSFHTERRAKDREEFEKNLKLKELMLEEYRKQNEEERRRQDEEEIQRLRKEAVPKAHPIRQYKEFNIQPSNSKLTSPKSPKFSTLKSRAKCLLKK